MSQELVTTTAKPIVGGDRHYHGGRKSALADEEFLDLFCKAYVTNITNLELAELFNVNEKTIRQWKKDPRVIAISKKMVEDRVLGIVRKIDSTIAARLAHPEKLETDILIKLRKEYLGGAFRAETEGGKDDPDTINAAAAALEDNPELMAELQELLAGAEPTPEDAHVVG